MTDLINIPPISSALRVDKGGFAQWPAPWANWFTKAQAILFASSQSGTTALRPTTALYVGRPYFDTTLGYPIWWDGSQFVDATGTPA